MPEARDGEEGLRREVRFSTAVTVVVGTVIGSGIFIGANRVAAGVESVAGLFAVWIGAGLLTLLGALTYAEFGAMYPRSGGDYVYVHRSLNPFFGFFVGWSSFAINLPASTAALALAFASQADALKPDAHGFFFLAGFAEKFTAVAVIAIFTIINYFGVRQGGNTQRALTFGKVGLILLLVGIGILSSESDAGNLVPVIDSVKDVTGSLAVAFVAALFAYDGWNAVSRIAGEVKDPQRILPRALTTGVLAVIAVYILLTLAYLLVLGLDRMAVAVPGVDATDGTDRLIASRAAQAVLGDGGEIAVALIIGVSILGTINGLILSGPRIYYAMARDGLFFPSIGRVHPVHRTPHISIIVQGLISGLLALFFTFEQLTAYVVVAAWVAYALTGYGLIRHRRLHPEIRRPYSVPFFPFVPALFTLLAGALLVFIFFDSLPARNDGAIGPLLYFAFNVVVLSIAVPLFRVLRKRFGPRVPPSHA